MGTPTNLPPGVRRTRLIALALAALVLVIGCGGPGASPTRSPGGSPVGPSTPPTGTGTPDAIGTPFTEPWPAGWDDAFCTMFAEMVVMQELAVDIGRTLEEGSRDDALALTRELALSAAAVREQLGALPAWELAAPLGEDILALLALADEMALRYERYLAQNRRPALALAEAAGVAMSAVVPDLLDRLILLAELRLACPGVPFNLETPPAAPEP